jgi:hypothetical protein
MAKMFKATPTKAYRVEAIEFEGQQLISIRQHYKTKGDPDTWKPGYQGITLPIKGAAKIGEYLAALASDPDTEFVHVEPKAKAEPKSKKAKK